METRMRLFCQDTLNTIVFRDKPAGNNRGPFKHPL